MTFPLASRDPASVAKVIGQALENQKSAEERPNDFGYRDASAQKRYSERFAGDIYGGNLGINGLFAAAVNNPEDKETQAKIGTWAQQWSSGPFGPGAMV